ncbi:hypothetical protein [Streptomyces sp. NPDC051162]|uniref:glycine-rich domain-containing protein n=1 Tax=Streptomyces sp. NPDC051162 TaxID=3154747 RepID=UPI003420D9BA
MRHVSDLLTGEQRAGVIKTVRDSNPDMTEDMAGRIVDEATKFVVAAACFPAVPLAPSRVVDEGWHALIVHTRLYEELCEQHGRFVQHSPGYDPTHYDPEVLERTRAVIEEAGYSVDDELWRGPQDGLVSVAANCQHAPRCAIRPMPKPEPPVS